MDCGRHWWTVGGTGGLWEALVDCGKVTKFHLAVSYVGEQRLTIEEMATVLCQIEVCLNSQRLVPINCHSEDGIDVMTPSHLIETCNLSQTRTLPLRNYLFSSVDLMPIPSSNTFGLLVTRVPATAETEQMADTSRHVKTDDVLLIKEDSLITTHWLNGRIVETFPGRDGKVRVVTVNTATGTYKRPVTKMQAHLVKNRKGFPFWWEGCLGLTPAHCYCLATLQHTYKLCTTSHMLISSFSLVRLSCLSSLVT